MSDTGVELDESLLTTRWTPLKPVKAQLEMEASKARFKVIVAGRRSGKTERAKRFVVKEAITFNKASNGRFICAGPTQDQSKEIWWNDLKDLTPSWALAKAPRESPPQTLFLYNGARIQVLGMDRPERVDGSPVDGFMWDEFADSKPHGWTRNVRPALSTIGRPGWARFLGKPKGSGTHFHKLAKAAANSKDGRWSYHTWSAAEVLSAHEIADLADDLDDIAFQQEVLGKFVSMEGRAYYGFDYEVNACEELFAYYDPKAPLILCFDFNVDPGVAVILQERYYLGLNGKVDCTAPITMCLGEVWIEQSSNTQRVCRKIVDDWGSHQGVVLVYGDPAGGARSTRDEIGNDYDIIMDNLRPEFSGGVVKRVAKSHPLVKMRVNAMNRRLRTANGTVRMLVCPTGCPKLCEDLDEVTVIPGTNGEILKEKGGHLTHITDGLGYYVERKFPAHHVGKREAQEII